MTVLRSGERSSIDLAALEAARAGAPDAWEAVVEALSGVVWTAAIRGSSSRGNAEDVYRLTWLRLADHLDEVDSSTISAWLIDTSRHEAARLAMLEKGCVRATA